MAIIVPLKVKFPYWLCCCFRFPFSFLFLFHPSTLLVYQICIAFELRLAQGFVAGAEYEARFAYTTLVSNGVLILCEILRVKGFPIAN